jgi:putative ABC transport system permease protein
MLVSVTEMRRLLSARAWIRAVWRRPRADQELEDELRFHVEERIRHYVDRGLTNGEARQRALRELGGLEQAKESCRDVRRIPVIETLLYDARYALRTFRRSPAYAAVAVLTLALGIGANSAIFSLVDGILLRPLPYLQPDRLVSVTGTYPNGAFVAMRDQITSMDVAAYAEAHEINLTGIGQPVRLTAAFVSAELMSILGARPERGRTFVSGEDHPGQDQFVILSHALWERQLAADPAIVGRMITLDGTSREVVGVMPPDFNFPSTATDVWLPLHADPQRVRTYWAGDFMPVLGRLRDGVTVDQARSDIRRFQSQVIDMFPWKMPASWNADVTVMPLQHGMVDSVRARLLVLLGVVALVLLIACANVANLSLARGASREKEIGIRAALGAARQRIARQVLTESVVLALIGGAVGLLIAAQGLTLLKRLLPADTPRLLEAQLDWRVLAFTGGLAIVTGLLFGLAPALHVSRAPLTEALGAGGRGASFAVSQVFRRALVIGEIALAVMLVVAAGLLVRSFWMLSHVNTGFRPEQVVTARITPNQPFCADADRCLAFYRRTLDEVRSAPGVRGVALANTPPLDGRVAKRSIVIPELGMSRDLPLFWLNVVTPEYFHVMSIPIIRGRSFTDADRSGNPAVAIIAAATAERYWPGETPIGKQIRFSDEMSWHTIVGIVADVRAYDLQNDEPSWIAGTLYLPYSPRATLEAGRIPAEMTIAVATTADPIQVETTVRRAVMKVSQEVPVSDVRSLRASVSDSVSAPASLTLLVAAFAGLALVLGMIGIYGVLSFLVSKRTREIGIRLALGARRIDVLWSVMREGLVFAAAGVTVGLIAAVTLARVLAGELYGVSPVDPVTYGSVAVVMTLVTLLACCVPTYRAMRVDPLIALRQE